MNENTGIKQRKEQAMRQHRKALAEGRSHGLTFWKRHYIESLPTLLRG